MPRKIAKVKGTHEGQRSIEDTGFTNNISSTPVDSQSKAIAYADLNLRSGSKDSLVDGIASPAMLDENPSERRKRKNHSVDGTEQGRSKLTTSEKAGAQARESVGQVTEILPTGSGKCNESNRKIGFLSLPGEVRNKIMDLALVPGHIYFSNRMQPVDRNGSPVFKSGCQVLATCRQLYQEGHVSFYSRNMFHLAPGPLSASWEYFGRLDSRHQDLIEKVSIEMSIVDLTPAVLKGIEVAFYNNCGLPIAFAEDHLVSSYVENALRDLWAKKLAGISETKNFNTIRLVDVFRIDASSPKNASSLCYWRALHLEGAGINKLLSSVRLEKDCQGWGEFPDDIDEHCEGWDGVLHGFFRGVLANTMGTFARLVWNETSSVSHWAALKRWMSELKIRTRDMDTNSMREQYFWNESSGWVCHRDL